MINIIKCTRFALQFDKIICHTVSVTALIFACRNATNCNLSLSKKCAILKKNLNIITF